MMHPAEPVARPQSTLWMLDLGQPLPVGPTLRIPVAFTLAGLEVAQELARAMDLGDQAVVVQRFDNGRHCYVGRIEGRLATYGWVTFDEEDIGELSLSIRLKAGEAYIWNCATLPAYRGQRLYPALLTHIVGELHRQGVRRVWICTDADNLPSQSGIVLAGLQSIGDVFISRVLTMHRAWLRGRPGIPERLVMDARQALLGGREEVWLAANSGEPSTGTMDQHLGQPLVLAGEPPGSARAAMIMLHGRGATAQDILTLTADLHCPGFIYLAPHAAGNTWYPNSFLAPIASNEPDLSSGLAVITSLLDQLAQVGIPAERTILLGFSQGACLSLEYTARNARRYGGVVGLSGGLIGPDGTPRDYPGSLAGTPVFLGCSDMDPYIPKERVEQATEALRLLGGNVTMQLYPHMDHTVNQDELHFVQGMMASVLSIGN
jgi:phospholipase/carboxylesterase